MLMVSVTAEVDAEGVLADLGGETLRDMGYARIDRAAWEKVGIAMRANDNNELLRLVSEIAYDQTGIVLPPIRVAKLETNT